MQHEDFIHSIRALVAHPDKLGHELSNTLMSCKLTYGAGGDKGLRGITYYAAWGRAGQEHPSALGGVCATGEESIVQLAGTTVHELAHVASGPTAGHGISWKDSCRLLGLTTALASGQDYLPTHFDPQLWERIVALGQPQDGNPLLSRVEGLPFVGVPGGKGGKAAPCPLGIGTKGGTSRGKGSGSRMRLYHCQCQPVVKVRVASDELDAMCNRCKAMFQRQST